MAIEARERGLYSPEAVSLLGEGGSSVLVCFLDVVEEGGEGGVIRGMDATAGEGNGDGPAAEEAV
jgi:hypothetical protein